MLTFNLFLQLACLLLPSMAYQPNKAFASMPRVLQTSKSELSSRLQLTNSNGLAYYPTSSLILPSYLRRSQSLRMADPDAPSEVDPNCKDPDEPSQPSSPKKKKKAALTGGGGRVKTSAASKKEEKVKIVFKEDGNKFLDLTGVTDISSCLSEEVPGRSKTIAILGTEGIGKSALFLVILKRLLKNPSTLDAEEFGLRLVESNEPLDKDIPLFADMETADGSPHRHLGISLIFTSFRPSRFKELIKNGWRKVMPTWSAEEQAYLFNSKQFQREYGKEKAQCAYDNMQFFGGAIRNSILCATSKESDAMGELEAVIKEKGELVCDRFFKAGFGGTEDVISDVLVHRNPHVVNGKYLFERRPYIYSFASPFVLRSLLQLKDRMLVTQARIKYNAGTFRGGDDGNEFELLCLHGFKISGVKFLAKPLTDGAKYVTVTFPRKEVLALNWREQKKYLEPNLLYIPPYGNLESGDAFCLIKIDERWTLVILQCTISETHPVKQNGVKIIHDCYSMNSQLAVDETVIMFMTPFNGKLETKQPLVTQDGEVVKRSTVVVSAQYKIENQLVSDDDIVA
eukprot:gene3172-3473_t